MFIGILAPVENRERHLDVPGVDSPDAFTRFGDPGQFGSQILRLVPVLTFGNRAREVRIEQSVLHSGQF
ncbi:MAG: hypothetical protein IT430_02725 [Phycisphaerales bacterium]|nr:hypothetical protein [Phycisphaerales bacterium]